jgi:O-succinylbenzoate synthase
MMVDYFRYSLIPRSFIGSVALNQPRSGALLRFTFSDKSMGYSDCHPWPELGDASLEVQLAELSQGRLTDLTRRSFSYAKLDARARVANRSCWNGLVIPPSHFLVPDFEKFDLSALKQVSAQGFSVVKFKLGKKFQKEAEKIGELADGLKQYQIRPRFDFNSSLSFEHIREFFEILGSARDQIDLIEDPTPYDARDWQKIQDRFGVRLALDRLLPEKVSEIKPQSISALVIKPAIQNPDRMLVLAKEMKCSVFVTSYLDHPFGQVCSAWTAAHLKKQLDQLEHSDTYLETCGLLSHSAYLANPFSNQLETQGPCLKSPLGLGFGFDPFLDELSWSPLARTMNNDLIGDAIHECELGF